MKIRQHLDAHRATKIFVVVKLDFQKHGIRIGDRELAQLWVQSAARAAPPRVEIHHYQVIPRVRELAQELIHGIAIPHVEGGTLRPPLVTGVHSSAHATHVAECYSNRGVALYEDMVFYGTLDAHLMAFDAATGTQLWDTEVGDNRESLSITGAPLVVKDMVLIGVGGGEFGIRGFIDAYDVHTGELRWRFWTTAGEDDPNNDTWLDDSWKTGGGPTWVTGTYDPESDLIFWGTGNPWPDMNANIRAGDNLYTNSVVALDADTGELEWYFQTSPRDEFEHDSTSEPMIIEEMWEGEMRKMVVQVSRNGHVYGLDRFTFDFLYSGAYTPLHCADLDASGTPVLP